MPELKRFVSETEDLEPEGTKVQIERKDLLGIGLKEGVVHRVDVEVFAHGRSRKIKMAEKVLDVADKEHRKTQIRDQVLQNHALLKLNGLPTFNTMRIDEKNAGSLYMTDLTEDGKKEVYSATDWLCIGSRNGKMVGNEKLIEISNSDDINKQLRKLFLLAVNNGCVISSFDVFFLVIDKKTRKADIILGDILNIYFVKYCIRRMIDETYESFYGFVQEINRHLSIQSRLKKLPMFPDYKTILDEK